MVWLSHLSWLSVYMVSLNGQRGPLFMVEGWNPLGEALRVDYLLGCWSGWYTRSEIRQDRRDEFLNGLNTRTGKSCNIQYTQTPYLRTNLYICLYAYLPAYLSTSLILYRCISFSTSIVASISLSLDVPIETHHLERKRYRLRNIWKGDQWRTNQTQHEKANRRVATLSPTNTT